MPAVRLAAPRLQSLDAFRGLTIAGMLLVNNPGSWEHIYPPLEHAAWNGWTPTDLVFPFFLFIVGVAIPFSLGRRLEEGAPRSTIFRRVVIRSLLIILLGVFLNAVPRFEWATLRLPGVLQRIGLVYLLAATIYLLVSPRLLALKAAVILLLYWAVMMLVPVPGVGAGSLTPDANLAQYLDSQVFGAHMWREHWDPEGLLSTLPAVATCLIGIQAGGWLRSTRGAPDKLVGLFVAGGAAILLGLLWDGWFPINKNLWTSSYVLFTGGLALQCLAALYAIVDLWGYRRWAWPFLALGANALLVFGLSGLFGRALVYIKVPTGGEPVGLGQWLYLKGFASWAGTLNGSLAFAVTVVLLFTALMAVPYRRGWYLRF